MAKLRRARRGLAVALLAVLANLLIPTAHDLAAWAAGGERITICAPEGLVTVIVAGEERRENAPQPFNHLCPECPSCPLCPTVSTPLATLPKAAADAFSPAPSEPAWPASNDISTLGHADCQPAFPRAPPA